MSLEANIEPKIFIPQAGGPKMFSLFNTSANVIYLGREYGAAADYSILAGKELPGIAWAGGVLWIWASADHSTYNLLLSPLAGEGPAGGVNPSPPNHTFRRV